MTPTLQELELHFFRVTYKTGQKVTQRVERYTRVSVVDMAAKDMLRGDIRRLVIKDKKGKPLFELVDKRP